MPKINRAARYQQARRFANACLFAQAYQWKKPVNRYRSVLVTRAIRG